MNIILNQIKNILINNVYTVSLYLRRIASAAVIFILARFLTLYDYGLYSSYTNIAGLCLLVTNLGYNEYILVSTKNELNKVRLEVIFFISFAIFFIIILFVGLGFFNIEQYFIFYLAILKVFFDNTFFTLILPYFQSAKKFFQIGKINIIYSLFIISLTLIAYIFHFSLIKFLVLYVIGGIINFIHCSYIAKMDFRYLFTKYKSFITLLDKSIIYYITVSAIVFIKGQLSSLFVSFVLPKEQVAIYFAAFNIATVLGLVSVAQIQQLYPELINKSYQHIVNTMKKNLKFIIGINLIILFCFIIFGKLLLLLLYGSQDYINAYPYLLVLTLCSLISSAGMVFSTYMTSQGHQKYKSQLQIEFLIVVIVLMCVYHKLGVWGAILTTFSLEIYTFLRYFIFCLKDISKKK